MRQTPWKPAAAGLLAMLLLAGCGPQPGTASSDVSAPAGDVSTSTSVDTITDVGTISTQTTTTGGQTLVEGSTSGNKKSTTTTTITKSSTSSRKTIVTTKNSGSSAIDLSMFPVTPKLSIQKSAAKVNNTLSAPATKIASTYSLVSAYDSRYAFVHQPGLAVFKGKLYAAYSRGYIHEDAPGQRVEVASMSLSNFGTWSKPVVVGKTREVNGDETCNQSGFLLTTEDKLFVYFVEKIYGPDAYDAKGNYKSYQENSPIASRNMMSYTTDGVTWTEPIEIGVAANESPRKTLSGQWLAGSGKNLLFCKKAEIDGFTWDMLGMTTSQYNNSVERGNLRYLTESSWYQTDDYIIHQMLRGENGYVWMAESYDNGKTWTEAYQTNFTSEASMANFGRLPDGRYYFVGSPTYASDRYPLMLYISEDGYNFNKAYTLRDEKYTMQKNGWAKGGYFAYPEVLIHGDYMYIHYSKQKEVSEVTRVKLSDIK